jgi:hypothetical protein
MLATIFGESAIAPHDPIGTGPAPIAVTICAYRTDFAAIAWTMSHVSLGDE